MSSCCISVMYDPDAVLRHTTPRTLLPHCSEQPLRLFHSNLSHCYSSLPFSSLSRSLPHTCSIFSPTPTSLRLIVSITLLCLHEHSSSFVPLMKSTVLLIAYYECNTCISVQYSGCIKASHIESAVWITVRSEASGRVVQFKEDQSSKGVCHICPLCRAAVTAGDNSFHQWQRRVWQPVKEIGGKFHKVTTHLNNATCQFNAAVLQRTEAC